MPTTRISVSYADRAFEVEGEQEFVERHAERLEALLGPGTTPAATRTKMGTGLDTAHAFGELLNELTSDAGTDRMLLAGWFVQQSSDDNSFTTAEANALLKEQAVKLGNPSQTAANLGAAKLIFRDKGKWKVARQGLDRLKTIGGPG